MFLLLEACVRQSLRKSHKALKYGSHKRIGEYELTIGVLSSISHHRDSLLLDASSWKARAQKQTHWTRSGAYSVTRPRIFLSISVSTRKMPVAAVERSPAILV